MKRMKKSVFFVALCVLSIGLTSCGNKEEVNNDSIKVMRELIVSTQDGRENLKVGETNQLDVNVYGVANSDVVFTATSDCVTVDENGLVTAVKPGSGTIEVSSKDDASLKRVVTFNVLEDLTQKNPQIKEMIDSFKEYDYKKGVRFNANISASFGGLGGVNLPLMAEYQQDDEGTNVHIQADLEKPLTGIAGMGNKAVKPLLVNYLAPNMDYLDDTDKNEMKYLDIYNRGLATYYATLSRNFGTDEAVEYAPYALSTENALETISPLGDVVLNLVSGLLGGNGGGSGGIEIPGLGFDISTIFTTDGFLFIQDYVYSFLDVETNEDSTKLSLNSMLIPLLNGFWSQAGLDKGLKIDLGGLALTLQLPTSFKEVSFTIENKNTESDQKFSKFEFNAIGLNSKGEEYTFINVTLDKPVVLDEGFIKEQNTKIDKYVAESAIAKEKIKEATTLRSLKKDYGVASDNAKANAKASELMGYYYEESANSKERQNLLYPMVNRINTAAFTTGEYVNVNFSSTEVGDEEEGKVSPIAINGLEKIDSSITGFTSSDEEIIAVDPASGTYHGVAQTYTGKVGSNNEKATNNYAFVKGSISYGEGKTKSFSQKVTYTGEKRAFASIRSSFNAMEGFDQETRTLKVKAGQTGDFKDLIKLPDGATDATMKVSTYTSDKKIITVNNKDTTYTVLDKYEEVEGEGVFRNLSGVSIAVNYNLGEEKVKDTVIFFVEVI